MSLPNGKRKTKYGKTQQEVKAWLQQYQKAIQEGIWLESGKIKFSDFLDRYTADAAAHTLKPSTLVSYQTLIRLHIKPELGALLLKQIRPDHLQNLYSEKLNQGLSRRTVEYIHAIIHRALHQALMKVLFILLAEHYVRRRMFIIFNLVFSQWDQIFKVPMITATAIDRGVHHRISI